MILLALETATDQCSAALYRDGAVYARSLHAPRRHAELRLRLLDQGLAEAGVARSAIDVAPLLTETIPLDQAARAFALAADRGRAMKVQLAF
jgi:hypothetical protein